MPQIKLGGSRGVSYGHAESEVFAGYSCGDLQPVARIQVQILTVKRILRTVLRNYSKAVAMSEFLNERNEMTTKM